MFPWEIAKTPGWLADTRVWITKLESEMIPEGITSDKKDQFLKFYSQFTGELETDQYNETRLTNHALYHLATGEQHNRIIEFAYPVRIHFKSIKKGNLVISFHTEPKWDASKCP